MSESNNTSRLSRELSGFCESESISEEGLREIIEQHRLTANNHHVDNYEFFCEACYNENVTEGIIRCLLEYFPDVASTADNHGQLPLHYACDNKNVTLNTIQQLVDAAPASVSSVSDTGYMPLHWLCGNSRVGERSVMEILTLLIEKYPAAVRHADNKGLLPIHIAASWGGSPEFCRVLVEAYPGSERITTNNGSLPLHYACLRNSVAMVVCSYGLYPEAINTTTTRGLYPIHAAIQGIIHQRDNPAAAVEIVQFLLNCDPKQKLIQFQGMSLLHFACLQKYHDLYINAALDVIKVIYDFYPDAIEGNEIMTGVEFYHKEVQLFILIQLGHARQAKVHRLMTTPDMSGQLPLHTALRNNSVSFGSIKLLVKGNPAAVQSADNSGALPLHIACMHYESVNVIQHLAELDASTLDAVDRDGNTALHLLCGGARYEAIALLLDEFDAVSVSTWNKDGKLPIDLLWESNAVVDRESIEFIECMYRLLRANPEMMIGINAQTMQSPASTCSTLPCQNRKKRKLGQ